MSLFDSLFSQDEKVVLKKKKKAGVSSTAGAIPVKNAKGQISMETVKVKRYVAGKIPEYAVDKNEDVSAQQTITLPSNQIAAERREDHGRRKIFEPQVIQRFDQTENQIEPPTDEKPDEDRRKKLRDQLLKQQVVVDEPIFHEHEHHEQVHGDEDESSDYTSESEDETLPRLKPVFVNKESRITVPANKDDLSKVEESKKQEMAEKRKIETKQIIAQLKTEELMRENQIEDEENIVITDDEDDETLYEQWKIRELQRINRNLEEAAAYEAEKQEIQRLRLMTEEERQAHLAANPKIVTNKAEKGEYRFLQKYYHRGVFYLDVEDNVLKQNFAEPTLEDRFDKSVLPKVMQVKNFGKAGRTKYTHLVDQDTSCFEGAWSKKNEISGLYANKIGGGMKQIFDRPGMKRKYT